MPLWCTTTEHPTVHTTPSSEGSMTFSVILSLRVQHFGHQKKKPLPGLTQNMALFFFLFYTQLCARQSQSQCWWWPFLLLPPLCAWGRASFCPCLQLWCHMPARIPIVLCRLKDSFVLHSLCIIFAVLTQHYQVPMNEADWQSLSPCLCWLSLLDHQALKFLLPNAMPNFSSAVFPFMT